MNRKCIGCGATLQCTDEYGVGTHRVWCPGDA